MDLRFDGIWATSSGVEAGRITVREAFDRHSGAYDEVFSNQKPAQEIRSAVWAVADTVLPAGSRIIDAGCGTGEDAIHFAQNGCHVTAIDISTGMISKVKMKVSESSLAGRIDCHVGDIENFIPGAPSYDGIFSNFGALNCVSDLAWLRTASKRSLKPGGHLVLVTMGRFYPLEFAVSMLKGQPARAFRRFRRRAEAVVEGVRIPVFYHSARAIGRALGSAFELEKIEGLRSLLPVPGLQHLERFGFVKWMRPIDRRICRFRLTASWADHFISVWRYRP
jgi:SAM-dependent methyltransferase